MFSEHGQHNECGDLCDNDNTAPVALLRRCSIAGGALHTKIRERVTTLTKKSRSTFNGRRRKNHVPVMTRAGAAYPDAEIQTAPLRRGRLAVETTVVVFTGFLDCLQS